MRTTNTVAIAVAVAIGLGACVSLRAADTDDRIESAAKKTYIYQTYLKHDRLSIESKDGIVTLTGTVSEASHKSLAEDTVQALPGVKSVVNRIEVKSSPSGTMADDLISAKVKGALLLH